MSIQGIGSNSPIQKIVNQPVQKSIPTESATPTRGSDSVELTGISQHLQTLKAGGDVRADKVADIKAQIAAGTYESDDKLDVAADRLLDDLQK
ncbi:MAG TPA: flagellar biosynthesis anti-sigma factor FlgM [Tepidisphaeraceae bacterium]|nr:flagellar biosynthesis anti-sigma factor FlgM [Tepidisphaeraceae bacterium]